MMPQIKITEQTHDVKITKQYIYRPHFAVFQKVSPAASLNTTRHFWNYVQSVNPQNSVSYVSVGLRYKGTILSL